jgi:hypothetical protein
MLDAKKQQHGPDEVHELSRRDENAERRARRGALGSKGESVVADEHAVCSNPA